MIAKEPQDRGKTLVNGLWPFSGASGAMIYGCGYRDLCSEVDDYLRWLATLPPSSASEDIPEAAEPSA